MSTIRPYLIRTRGAPGKPRLVNAANPSQALRHVANETFTVKAATGAEVADCMRLRVPLETAGEEAPTTAQAPANPAPAAVDPPAGPIDPPPVQDSFLEGIQAAAGGLDAALADQREDDAPEDLEDGSAALAWVRDDNRILEAILIIDEPWTGFGDDDNVNLARIRAWNDATCEAVEAFCLAVAADPADLASLPVRPDVIGGPLPGQAFDDAAPELPL